KRVASRGIGGGESGGILLEERASVEGMAAVEFDESRALAVKRHDALEDDGAGGNGKRDRDARNAVERSVENVGARNGRWNCSYDAVVVEIEFAARNAARAIGGDASGENHGCPSGIEPAQK